MARIFNKEIGKKDLLRRVGNLSQIAEIRPMEFTESKAKGTAAYEVVTGSGLSFTVLKDKCLDISSMKFKGVNLNFLTKPGVVAPNYFNPHGAEFGRYFQAGMLYTCGLRNVGADNTDMGEESNAHGRIGHIPAENVAVTAEWEGDEYNMAIAGQMREGSQFAENMLLSRKIETKLGSSIIKIKDVIENQGFEEQPFMMLYHFNMGYPLLDADSKLMVASKSQTPRDEASADSVGDWDKLVAPIDGYLEQVYYHTLGTDDKGFTTIALANENLGFAVYVKFSAELLPNLIEWKSMMSGDYTLGLEPANCYVGGRAKERARGTLKTLKPFETVVHELEFGIVEGKEEMEKLENYIKSLR